MTRQLSLRVPVALLEQVDRRAKRRKVNRADVIRAALVAYLEVPDGLLEQRPIDRVRHLIGSIGDLPPDLASHPERYKGGFGRRR